MRGLVVALLALSVVFVAACAGSPDPVPEPEQDPLPIRVVQFPGQTILTRAYTGPFSEIGSRITDFIAFLVEENIEVTGDLGAALFDDPATTPPEETRYEIRIPVAPETVVVAPYEIKVMDPVDTAAVLLIGSYESIAGRYEEIYTWIDENGYVPDGPLMEVYLLHPGSDVPPEQFETEVHVPVRQVGE